MARAIPLVMVLVFALVATSHAQMVSLNRIFGRYQQFQWREQDGLPQNTVLAITTTRDGYLWVGTYEGLARFDGARFTVFNPANTAAIGNSFVTSLLEDRAGNLWIATWGGGLARLSEGRFTRYTTHDGLSTDFIGRLFEDQAGTLWIGTEGGGAISLRDGRFTAYTTDAGLPGNVVRAFVDDGDGGLLVGTNRGIARIAAGRVSAYQADAEPAEADISTLARARDGALWVAVMNGGLYRVDSRGVTRFGPRHGFTHDPVESLHPHDDGHMWVGTSTGGLFRYADGRFESYSPAHGLPGGRVAAIVKGVGKDTWIGTDGGLVRFMEPRFTVFTRRDGLASEIARDIYQDEESSVWVGSRSGLSRFKDGAWNVFTMRDGLPDDQIHGIGPDNAGGMWVRTRTGIVHWKNGRFVRHNDDDAAGGIRWDRVTALLRDRSDTLWVGFDGDGLMQVRDGHTRHLRKKDGLADDTVLALFEDRAGSVWIGTLRGGVTRISHDKATSWSIRDGLANEHVKAFYEDASGALWIGTHGGGLSRFRDGKFDNVSSRQGLYNDTIFRILEDDDGNLWMNGNKGIWRASLNELHEVADGRRANIVSFGYGVADGMLSGQGVGAKVAGWKMRDGSLWFPTTTGVVVVDPRRHDAEPPRVVIEAVAVDREPKPVAGQIRIGPGHENLEIQYTGLSWTRPREMKFRFRMAGLDRDWVDAGTRRTAYYSHLPPGDYTFTVIADNGEGVWNATGQSLAIEVLPPFYQTWWFLAVAISAVAGLGWFSWQRRVAQLQRAHVAQQAFSRRLIESQEGERQRIAAELHDSLGQSLLVVKNRALLGLQSQPDEQAQNQLTEIGATAAQALEEVRAIAFNLRPSHLDQLGLTTAITAMIQKVAESSAIRLTSEIDDIDGVFESHDEITIYRIIQEGLNNVVKHSRATDARVRVQCRERHVEITILDNGQGFAPDAPIEPLHRGLGLAGLSERVQMLGGSHAIESSPGRGTKLTVSVALRAHGRGRAHGE